MMITIYLLQVYLHGSFMVAAWIGSASIGILLARYFKKTWVGSQLCGKDQWFAVSFIPFNNPVTIKGTRYKNKIRNESFTLCLVP